MSKRQVLPTRRQSYTEAVHIDGSGIFLTVGLQENGCPGEIFITIAKEGAALRYWAENTAILFSLALQHGVELERMVDRFCGTKSTPYGPVQGHHRIRTCTSIMDFVVRSLTIEFLGRNDLADIKDEDNSTRHISQGE